MVHLLTPAHQHSSSRQAIAEDACCHFGHIYDVGHNVPLLPILARENSSDISILSKMGDLISDKKR